MLQSSVIAGTNTWTLHTDAAWDGSSECCGLSWYFQDPQNANNTLKYSSNRRFVTSALVVEALAVKAALSTAASLGIQHINAFSDCKTLVALFKKKERDVSVLNVLHDINSLADSFESFSFQFVPRIGNVRADTLAKSALFELQNSPLLG